MKVSELKQALSWYEPDAEIVIATLNDHAVSGCEWSTIVGIAPSGMGPEAILVCTQNVGRDDTLWDHISKDDCDMLFGEDSQMYPEDNDES